MRRIPLSRQVGWAVLAVLLVAPVPALAQGSGTVAGTVVRGDDGSALQGVSVTVQGTNIVVVTNTRGEYIAQRVPAGQQVMVFRWVGYQPVEVSVTVTDGGTVRADARMEAIPITLAEIVVEGASRAPERVVQAPSAISQVDPRVLQSTAVSGQAALVLRDVPGVDLIQNGVHDFNVNTRGFNSSLNRRVLVLQDGRDLAIAFLQSQEWTALSLPLDDFAKVEFVSGPGSALYGANAYNGVLDLTTPTARQVAGTKVAMGGGTLSTLRGDIRHAGVLSEGKFGYRLNAGYSSSDTWSRSRTLRDRTALQKEYAAATDSAVPLNLELRPLAGEVADPTTGIISGDRDPIQSIYGSGRFDYYLTDGSVLTAEGGATRVENEVFITGIGRVQVTGAVRPWSRVAYAHPRYNIMAYWNGRRTIDPQYSLASGAPLREYSDIFHVEAQTNQPFGSGRGLVVFGASARRISLDTRETLMVPDQDDRNDGVAGVFGQLSWQFGDAVRLVAAARWDNGSIIAPQFSPKAALVITPDERNSIRFSVNKAFQTPNYSEFFLKVPAGAPANFSLLEAGMRASPLGPALAGVPSGQLFDNSAAVPVWARGNADLEVETTTGYEIGYRGDLTDRLWVTLDGFYNRLSNFVTDLFPGVNPAFPAWTAPTAVPEAFRAPLEQAVRNALLASPATALAGRGLTRTEDGRTAIVVSYANAGEAKMWGVNLGAGWQLSEQVRADGFVSWFDHEVDQSKVLPGDQILPNTPQWRTRLGLSYNGRQGLDVRVGFRTTSGFPWNAGVYSGWVEPAALVDADLGYRINNNFRVYLTGTNVLDKQWFSIYGGSVNGSRILGGLTANF